MAGVVKKSWGTAKTLYLDDHLQIVEIRVKAGGRSSIHKHDENWNLFVVLRGRLQVDIFRADGQCASPRGGPENSLICVRPKQQHRFTGITETVAREIYFREPADLPLNPNDIIRGREG